MITKTKRRAEAATAIQAHADSAQAVPVSTNPHTLQTPIAHTCLRGQTTETVGLIAGQNDGHEESPVQPIR